MTTFQAVITAFVSVLSEILPISPVAHQRALELFLGWTEPQASLLGTIYLGLFISLLLYFKYDFLSFTSQALQVLIYRKKPKSIDEKLSLFVLLSLIFPILGWFFFTEWLSENLQSPFVLASITTLSGFLILLANYYSKKSKTHYSWTWLDALLLGIGQLCMIIPGIGRATGAMILSSIRNFDLTGAAKFTLYCATPLIGLYAYFQLHQVKFNGFTPEDLSPLTFWVTLVTSFLVGLLAIKSFLKKIEDKTLRKYAIYRIVLSAGIVVAYLMNSV